MNQTASDTIVVPIKRRRSLGTGISGLGLAAAIGALTGAIAFDPEVTGAPRLVTLLLGGTLSFAFVALSVTMMAWRGGIAINQTQKLLGIGLTSRTDAWWLSLDTLRGLSCQKVSYRKADDQITSYSVQIERHGAYPISIFETADGDEAETYARIIEDVLPLERVDHAPAKSYDQGDTQFAIKRNWALQWPITLFGISLVTVGLGLMLGQGTDLVFALFFAPVLAVLGFIFLGIALFKALGRETLTHPDDHWCLSYRLGPIRWGRKIIRASHPHWRVQIHPLRGACLELIGEDGILVMAAGATTRSTLTVAKIAEIPTRFATVHLDSESPVPPLQASADGPTQSMTPKCE
jgi:hypothetical protein